MITMQADATTRRDHRSTVYSCLIIPYHFQAKPY